MANYTEKQLRRYAKSAARLYYGRLVFDPEVIADWIPEVKATIEANPEIAPIRIPRATVTRFREQLTALAEWVEAH